MRLGAINGNKRKADMTRACTGGWDSKVNGMLILEKGMASYLIERVVLQCL